MGHRSDSNPAGRAGQNEWAKAASEAVPVVVLHDVAVGAARIDSNLGAFQFAPGHWAIEWMPLSGAPIVLNGVYTSKRAADAAIPLICERLALSQPRSTR